MVHVEQVRVEFDMADLSRVLRGGDGRVGEDLDGRVRLGARESVGDGADDFASGKGLRERGGVSEQFRKGRGGWGLGAQLVPKAVLLEHSLSVSELLHSSHSPPEAGFGQVNFRSRTSPGPSTSQLQLLPSSQSSRVVLL